jgi:nucleoside-specific outer membrane channel protein Tsx
LQQTSKPVSNFIKNVILAICVQGLFAQPVDAFDWTKSDIQLLYGEGFKFGSSKRATITVEHVDGWQYGTNYFFADFVAREDTGINIYAEVYSYLSMTKLTGKDWTLGLFKDVFIAGGLNIGNKPEHDNFKAYLLGVSFDLSNSLIDFLQVDVFAFKADNISGRYGMQITPVWGVPFEIAGIKFKFRGFADFSTGNTNSSGNFQILTQPQFLLDVGYLAGLKSDKLYVGTKYSFNYNKFGVKGVNESVVQAEIIVFF